MFGTKFWDGIATGVAKKWVDRLFSPALMFWVAGLLAFAATQGWDRSGAWLAELEDVKLFVLVVGALVIVATSSVFVEEAQLNTLQLLEGYWPCWLAPLRRYQIKKFESYIVGWNQDWNKLAARYTQLTSEELDQYSRLEVLLASYPVQKRLMPTVLGNRLRAAEDYAWNHYRLATAIVWPRLWLLLPECVQREISEARERLNAAVRWILWSLMLLVWSAWAWWWIVPVALLGALWGYWQALRAAGIYGELLRAVFDIYRPSLYESLRLPLPKNPAEELATGYQLTYYLWRGLEGSESEFTP